MWVVSMEKNGTEIERFTTEDGLPHNRVSAIVQDRRGDMWFGTGAVTSSKAGGGVSRYDGERFETFSTQDGLLGNSVECILEDREGTLWFGTERGVSRYDGKRFEDFGRTHGLTDGVTSIAEDAEGTLFFW